MVNFPWGRSSDEEQEASEASDHPGAIVECEFHDGSLAVYEDEIVITRKSRSEFEDKTIPFEDVTGVDFAKGITIGYVQIELVGIEPDEGSLLSDPVNENTLHFGRRSRDCAREARDAILERARG